MKIPFKPVLVRFNLITRPAWLQEMLNQLHGIELVFWSLKELVALLGGRVNEDSSGWVSFSSLAFQLSKASVSASLFTETESATNEECNMANTTRETGESNLFKVDRAMVFVLQIANISIPLYIKAPPGISYTTIYRI